MPIDSGYEIVECTKDEFEAGYDIELGIDILLTFVGGSTATMQEKILFTTWRTVPVEYYQNWRTEEKGDWFNMKCQYYSALYDTGKNMNIDDGVIINWPQAQLATSQQRIRWFDNKNTKDNALASFKYAFFDQLPTDVVIARMDNGHKQPSLFSHRRSIDAISSQK